jgi:hypothetical protein
MTNDNESYGIDDRELAEILSSVSIPKFIIN